MFKYTKACLLACLGTAAVADTTTSAAQQLLNQLGYNAGPVDGVYGKKTKDALTQFYISLGEKYDEVLSENEIIRLREEISSRGLGFDISTMRSTYVESTSKTDILHYPKQPSLVRSRYWWTHGPTVADFNGDGIMDVWITGVKQGDRDTANANSENTGDICGSKGFCSSSNTRPSFFLGNLDGTFNLRDDLVVDDRRDPGQNLAHRNLIADFNGDGRLDIYVSDQGVGNHDGYRDSYFLSHPDGTLLESSATHLSQPNLSEFNHATTVGDIDGDGDFDVVAVSLKEELYCLVNDGHGFLRKRTCGRLFAYGIELADVDNDGDLDLIHASNEEFDWNGPWKTGIALNDGRGNFRYRSIQLPMNERWGTVPKISAWDLDGDGDQDIVMTRTTWLYAGTAIEILENLGEGRFDSSLYELSVPPASYKPTSEGNEWNSHIEMLNFKDVDSDGDIDIIIASTAKSGQVRIPDGSILQNNGNMNFEYKTRVLRNVSEQRFRR